MSHDPEESRPDGVSPEAGRRRLLAALAASVGAAAAAAVAPRSWTKPLVDAVEVPAHAQASPTLVLNQLTLTPPVPPPADQAAPAFPTMNWTARFGYQDQLAVFSPLAAYLYSSIGCGGTTYPLVDWQLLSAVAVTNGTMSTGTVQFMFTVPPMCASDSIVSVQCSYSGGLSNTVTCPLFR